MRFHWTCVTFAALSIFGSVAAAQPAHDPAAPAYGMLELERISDRVHVARQPDRWWLAVTGNVTIIEQEDGFVLIDSAGGGDGRHLVSLIRSLGPKPVKAVAITHWHGDHYFSLPRLRAAWPRMRVIATRRTGELMRTAATRFVPLRATGASDAVRLNNASGTIARFEASARDPSASEEDRREYGIEAGYLRARMSDVAGTHIVLPTQTFTDRLVIPDRDAPVELRFIGRGNTAGDLLAWLPRQRILATGDMVIAPSPYGFNVTPGVWIETLERLKSTFDFAVLIPGHGAPQRDALYIDRMIASMQAVRAWTAARVAEDLTLEQTLERATFEEEYARFGADTPWQRRVVEGYWLAPLVSSAWREAKGEAIVEGT